MANVTSKGQEPKPETQTPDVENDQDKMEATMSGEKTQVPEVESAAPAAKAQLPKAGKAAPAAEESTSRNTVYVFANLPHGQSFTLPNGRMVTLNGYPVSLLVGQDGEALPAGRFGVTEVAVDDWEAIKKLYGEMVVMKSGLIFAAASLDRGEVMAAERQALRHGLEQIDPKNTATKPKE